MTRNEISNRVYKNIVISTRDYYIYIMHPTCRATRYMSPGVLLNFRVQIDKANHSGTMSIIEHLATYRNL